MQKPSFIPDPESSPALRHGQFQQPVNPAPRSPRTRWGVMASAAVLLVVLVTVFAWLLPHLTQMGMTTSHTGLTPTIVPIPPTLPSVPFTAQDSGKTVTYPMNTIFELVLNGQQYPSQSLQLVCDPQGALAGTPSGVAAAYPLYFERYQALAPGTCTIENGDFTLTVIVTGMAATPTATPASTSLAIPPPLWRA